MTSSDDDDIFAELTEDVDPTAFVVIKQEPDFDGPEYDLVGDVELDEAIVMTLKSLIVMVLDSMSFKWPAEDEEPDD